MMNQEPYTLTAMAIHSTWQPVKGNAVMQNALEITHEVTKLVKLSPCRDELFQNLKKEIAPEGVGIRVLCPTRWTVRAEALSSIVNNYDVLMSLWKEAAAIVKDSVTIARIKGVSAYMEKFTFLFGVILGEMVLGHTDNLSKSLQVKTSLKKNVINECNYYFQ